MQQNFVCQLAIVKWSTRSDEMRLRSWEKGMCLAWPFILVICSSPLHTKTVESGPTCGSLCPVSSWEERRLKWTGGFLLFSWMCLMCFTFLMIQMFLYLLSDWPHLLNWQKDPQTALDLTNTFLNNLKSGLGMHQHSFQCSYKIINGKDILLRLSHGFLLSWGFPLISESKRNNLASTCTMLCVLWVCVCE